MNKFKMSISNKVLIHETEISGHRLEYIHHLYIKAVEYPDTEFIFALPNEFEEVKDKLEWKEASNIQFYLFPKDISKMNKLKDSYNKSKRLKTIISQFNIDSVFLISLMQFLPMLPFLISNNVKVSGIIYTIYLYRWKDSSFIGKLQDGLKYLLFARMSVFKNVFMLNDAASARWLNYKFKTDKFKHLPDPFVPIPNEDIKNIRQELGIKEDKKMFIHFGGLSRVKGTIEILDAISLIDSEQLNKLSFVFAGKVYDDIKNEFYTKVKALEDRVQIIVIDKFCEFSFLGSLCFSTDYILIPYKRTSNSSGLIGYAAQFGKPVIAPNERLLGKLVRKYGLGITIKDTKPETIAEMIKESITKNNEVISKKYVEDNNIEKFTNMIFENTF